MRWGHWYVRRARKVLHALSTFILPLRIHTRSVARIRPEHIRIVVTEHTLLNISITTLLSYKDLVTKHLIEALKYEQSDRAALICAHVLSDYLCELCASAHTFSPREIYIIPIPAHPERVQERGIDHIRRICEHLPGAYRVGPAANLRTDVLRRIRHTPAQAHLGRGARLRNIRGAFEVSTHISLRGIHTIVIDDVTTTGATLKEAARVLRASGAQVTAIALARA